jgi:hypothetical protein
MTTLICLAGGWFASLLLLTYAIFFSASSKILVFSLVGLWVFSLLLVIYAIRTAVPNKD